MKIKSVTIKDEYFIDMFSGEFWIFSKNNKNGSVPGIPALSDESAFLWGRLEEGLSIEELIEALVNKKKMDFEDAEDGVCEFLAKLINGKIVDVNYN